MYKKLNQALNTKHAGFSGINHVLITIGLFVLLFFIPVAPFTDIVARIKETPVTFIMSFLIICGAALLPDLDNIENGGSSAQFSLGVFGGVISSLMVTISSIMTTIFRGKKDPEPPTQHRWFWHTLLIPLIITLLVFFFVPAGDTKAIDLFTAMGSGGRFPTSTVVILLMIFICVYVGSALLLKKINKWIPAISFKPGLVALILGGVALVIALVFSNQTDLRFYGFCVAIGYVAHLIGDAFADSGVPLLFPITGIFKKFWMRIRFFPVTVTTGGVIETILKFIFTGIDFVLLYCLFAFVLFK